MTAPALVRVFGAAARRLGPALSALAVVGTVLAAAGCAATSASPQQELRTASDMTDLDRRAKLRMELAAGYFARGQLETALDEVKLALAARPDLPDGYNLRGLIYASLGQYELAEQSFQRALQLDPRSADAMHNYGYFLCRTGRTDAAEAQFDRALGQPQYRDAARTLAAKGACELGAGRLADAERTLLRALEVDPANAATAYYLGDTLYRRGDLERARFYLQRVNAQPATSNAQSLWLAARIEQRRGDAAALRALGQQLRTRFPQSPETLRFERGQFDE